MTPEQIKELIDQLMRTGEILATKAFEMSMRQVYVEAWTGIALGILFLIIAIVFAFLSRTVFKKSDEGMGLTMGIMTFVISLLAIPDMFINAFQRFANPEWFAVKLLLESFLK